MQCGRSFDLDQEVWWLSEWLNSVRIKMWRLLGGSALMWALWCIQWIPRGTLVYMCCGKTSKQNTISCKLLSWSFVIVSGEVHRIYRTSPTQIYGLCGNRPTPSKTHCRTTKEKRRRTKCAGQDKKMRRIKSLGTLIKYDQDKCTQEQRLKEKRSRWAQWKMRREKRTSA